MFEIAVDNSQVMNMLQGLRQRMSDLRPAWQQAKGIISSSVAANFAAQGRPQWPSAKRDLGHPLLVRTGGLRSRAMLLQLRSGASGAVFFSAAGVVGAAHQFGVHRMVRVPGSGRKKGYAMRMNLPARPFMLLASGEAKRIAGVIEAYLLKGT